MKSHIENIREIKGGCLKKESVKDRGEQICSYWGLCPSCRGKLDGYLISVKVELDFFNNECDVMNDKIYYKIKDCEQAILEGMKPSSLPTSESKGKLKDEEGEK